MPPVQPHALQPDSTLTLKSGEVKKGNDTLSQRHRPKHLALSPVIATLARGWTRSRAENEIISFLKGFI